MPNRKGNPTYHGGSKKGNRWANYGEGLCNKCGKPFDPQELPPSLRNTLRRCRSCYNAAKKIVDKDWLKANPDRKSIYNKKARMKEKIKQRLGSEG